MGDSRLVFFFDVDNCVCESFQPSKSSLNRTRVLHLMSDLINQYFQNHLSLSQEDAHQLHMRYYKEYGLAIEGLVRHHKVDPLEYNRKVDDALPLENIIRPDPQLRKLLEDIDKSKVKLWLLTNAYVTHAKRVVKLLGVEDLFEGVTYCDYAAETLLCKPHKDMYMKAMAEAGATSVTECYFVDDSGKNTEAAKALGWTTVHLIEASEPAPKKPAAKYQIQSLEELRQLFPDMFKQTSGE